MADKQLALALSAPLEAAAHAATQDVLLKCASEQARGRSMSCAVRASSCAPAANDDARMHSGASTTAQRGHARPLVPGRSCQLGAVGASHYRGSLRVGGLRTDATQFRQSVRQCA